MATVDFPRFLSWFFGNICLRELGRRLETASKTRLYFYKTLEKGVHYRALCVTRIGRGQTRHRTTDAKLRDKISFTRSGTTDN